MIDMFGLGVRAPLGFMHLDITYSRNLGLASQYSCICRTRIVHERSTV